MEEPTTTRVIPERDGPDRSEAAVRFGIATAARDVGISVGIVLGLLYLFPVLGRVMSGPRWDGGPPQPAPIAAGLKLQARTGLGSSRSAPGSGLACSSAWPRPPWWSAVSCSASATPEPAADGTCRRQPCSEVWPHGRWEERGARPTAPGTRRCASATSRRSGASGSSPSARYSAPPCTTSAPCSERVAQGRRRSTCCATPRSARRNHRTRPRPGARRRRPGREGRAGPLPGSAHGDRADDRPVRGTWRPRDRGRGPADQGDPARPLTAGAIEFTVIGTAVRAAAARRCVARSPLTCPVQTSPS